MNIGCASSPSILLNLVYAIGTYVAAGRSDQSAYLSSSSQAVVGVLRAVTAPLAVSEKVSAVDSSPPGVSCSIRPEDWASNGALWNR